MADPAIPSADLAISFGPFRLLPAQQLLLEGDAQVRLGSRALAILNALVQRAGEVVPKSELMAQVWPDTFVDEGSLRFHIAGLRRALGDGQPGRRYLANIPGRGYQFVAQVDISRPETARHESAGPAELRSHNLPFAHTRAVGRANVIDALRGHVSQQRLVTIVGAGGIGKTTVALAVAETLLPTYPVRFVDLAPIDDPQHVPSALGVLLGLALNRENAIARLVEYLSDKQMLIVFDSCEHVVEAAASLAEQVLAGAPGVHILATSREPLRVQGERLHRLQPLAFPMDPTGCTAAQALSYPAVQLFVERAIAILDGFELTDADAPIVSDICRKLGGFALAIELAAARVDAFGIRQLDAMLDDRFRILKLETRTAQPRHQSLAATLDWSYEFLPEIEQTVLRRLSVFAAAFTLEAALAVAGDDDTDAVAALADLVAKSLVSADVGGAVVQYRLLDTTRAYAIEKLNKSGDFGKIAHRHALYHLDRFKSAATDWQRRTEQELLSDYGSRMDDVRAALGWAFSPPGDALVGAALMVASIPIWLELTLIHECHNWIEKALAGLSSRATTDRADELKLRLDLGLIVPYIVRPLPASTGFWTETYALAQELNDLDAQAGTLAYWFNYCWYVSKCNEALEVAERSVAVADRTGDQLHVARSQTMLADALYSLGRHSDALRHAEPVLNQNVIPTRRTLFANRMITRSTFANILWVLGFPDRAIENMKIVMEEGQSEENIMTLTSLITRTGCPIALNVGDLAELERLTELLLDRSTKGMVDSRYEVGRCFKGALLLARNDPTGLTLLRDGLAWLREARFSRYYVSLLGTLAQGLGAAGRISEARGAIDEAIERAESSEELWCLPEQLRIKGEILRLEGSGKAGEGAEYYFQKALALARQQQALSWELRAATSLAKLWRDQGKIADAERLLSGVYDRFTEGFHTLDLRAARELISELRGKRAKFKPAVRAV